MSNLPDNPSLQIENDELRSQIAELQSKLADLQSENAVVHGENMLYQSRLRAIRCNPLNTCFSNEQTE